MSANFSLVLFVTTGFITIAGGTTIVLDPYDGLVDACNHNDPSYLICNVIIRILPAGARYLKKGLVITTLVKKISKSIIEFFMRRYSRIAVMIESNLSKT